MDGTDKCQQIAESVAKSDITLKFVLYPKQFFVGNFEVKLTKNDPVRFYVNKNKRLTFAFHVDYDAKNGIAAQEIGISLTKIEALTLKKGEYEMNPGGIIIHLTQNTSDHLLAELGCASKIIEEQLPPRRSSPEIKRLVTVVLRPDTPKPGQPSGNDVYMRVSYGSGDSFKVFEFDSDEAIDLMQEQLLNLHISCLSGKWKRRDIVHQSRTLTNIDSICLADWHMFMCSLRLFMKVLNDDSRYFYFPPKEMSYHIPKKRLPTLFDFSAHLKRSQKRAASPDNNVHTADGHAQCCGSTRLAASDLKNGEKYEISCKNERNVEIRASTSFFENRKLCELKFTPTKRGQKRKSADAQKTNEDGVEKIMRMEVEENDKNRVNVENAVTECFTQYENNEITPAEIEPTPTIVENLVEDFSKMGEVAEADVTNTVVKNEITDNIEVKMEQEEPDEESKQHIDGVEHARNESYLRTLTPEEEMGNIKLDEGMMMNWPKVEDVLNFQPLENNFFNAAVESSLNFQATSSTSECAANVPVRITVPEVPSTMITPSPPTLEFPLAVDHQPVFPTESYQFVHMQSSSSMMDIDRTVKTEVPETNEVYNQQQSMFYSSQFPGYLNSSELDQYFVQESIPPEYMFQNENDMKRLKADSTLQKVIDSAMNTQKPIQPRLYENKVVILEQKSLPVVEKQIETLDIEDTQTPVAGQLDNEQNEKKTVENIKENDDAVGISCEEALFQYPSKSLHPSLEQISVTIKDANTLGPAEFVNDAIIQFFILYVQCHMDTQLGSRTHFFNTFFYSGLAKQLPTSSNGKKEFNVTNATMTLLFENAKRLVKWTKKLDLFEKDFVVVPINEEFHWLLAIIVNPRGSIVERENEEESRNKPKSYILFFDPLNGLDPNRNDCKYMCFYLQKYLMTIYEMTKAPGGKFATPTETFFDPTRIVTVLPKNLPVQGNYLDCGAFVMYFIEMFFMNRKPVELEEVPTLDWEEKFPMGRERADIMRHKVHALMVQRTPPSMRSRLEKYEQRTKRGMAQDPYRNSRHHSSGLTRRSKRHSDYHKRFHSLDPPASGVMERTICGQPRILMEMELTRVLRTPKPLGDKCVKYLNMGAKK